MFIVKFWRNTQYRKNTLIFGSKSIFRSFNEANSIDFLTGTVGGPKFFCVISSTYKLMLYLNSLCPKILQVLTKVWSGQKAEFQYPRPNSYWPFSQILKMMIRVLCVLRDVCNAVNANAKRRQVLTGGQSRLNIKPCPTAPPCFLSFYFRFFLDHL